MSEDIVTDPVVPEVTPPVSNDPAPIDMTSDVIKAAIEDAVKKATSGLMNNRDTILSEKRDLEAKLKGIDVDDYETLKSARSQAEEDKLKEAQEYEQLLTKKTSDLEAKFTGQLESATKRAEAAEVEITNYKTELKKQNLSNQLREEVVKSGVLAEAVDNVVGESGLVFSLSETNELEARDVNGNLVLDADNVVMTPAKFLQNLKTSKAFYWGTSQGSGLSGSAPPVIKQDLQCMSQ